MAPPHKKEQLAQSLKALRNEFADRILSFDEQAGENFGAIA